MGRGATGALPATDEAWLGRGAVLADARGHGMSDPPTADTPTDAQAEDLAALITALDL